MEVLCLLFMVLFSLPRLLTLLLPVSSAIMFLPSIFVFAPLFPILALGLGFLMGIRSAPLCFVGLAMRKFLFLLITHAMTTFALIAVAYKAISTYIWSLTVHFLAFIPLILRTRSLVFRLWRAICFIVVLPLLMFRMVSLMSDFPVLLLSTGFLLGCYAVTLISAMRPRSTLTPSLGEQPAIDPPPAFPSLRLFVALLGDR